jgi:hypothetical protein
VGINEVYRQARSILVIGTALGFLAACAMPSTRDADATLRITSISPWPGTALGPDMIVSAELEYFVPQFAVGEYFVIGQAEMNDGSTSDGNFPDDLYPVLLEPEGRIHFHFPVYYVADQVNLKRPIVIWFYLNRGSLRQSAIIAKAGPITFAEP